MNARVTVRLLFSVIAIVVLFSNYVVELAWGDAADKEPYIVAVEQGNGISGYNFISLLMSDGTVRATGNNSLGQLGNGTRESISYQRSTEVLIDRDTRLKNIQAIAAGDNFTIALDHNGQVWSWGFNQYGALGHRTENTESVYATMINGLNDIQSISADYQNVLALDKSGQVWQWGTYVSPYAGVDSEAISSPIKVRTEGAPLNHIEKISAGALTNLALDENGRVWGWGINRYGTLGFGEEGLVAYMMKAAQKESLSEDEIEEVKGNLNHIKFWDFVAFTHGLRDDDPDVYEWKLARPVTSEDESYIAMAAGVVNSLFVKDNNDIYARGLVTEMVDSSAGMDWEAGKGKFFDNEKLELSASTSIASVSLDLSGYIKQSDGSTWCWGAACLGAQPAQQPVRMKELDDFQALNGKEETVVGLKEDGTVWIWDNSLSRAFSAPQRSLLADSKQAALGSFFSVVLKKDGTVWSAGDNDYGQLGDRSNDDRDKPVQVVVGDGSALTNIVSVANGKTHAIALGRDGTVWAWGSNFLGELGNGTREEANYAAQVHTSDGILNDVIAIAAGGNYSQALKKDGTVWEWGVHDLYYTGPLNAVQVFRRNGPLTGIVAIATGDSHSLAVDGKGEVYSWGSNDDDQLGVDTQSVNYAIPVDLGAISSPIVSVSAGESHSLALAQDGTVWGWGSNQYGRLGDADTAYSTLSPVQVMIENGQPLTGITTIDAGLGHNLAIDVNHKVWVWGDNSFGELGIADDSIAAVQARMLNGLSNVQSVSAGFFSSMVVQKDGTVWGFGSNEYGQLMLSTKYRPIKQEQLVLTLEERRDDALELPIESAGNDQFNDKVERYSDIEAHWAERAIMAAADLGIVTGYEGGSFRPEAAITRAEFTVMLMRALKLEGEGTVLSFNDAIPTWAQDSVAQAVKNGIVAGYEDGTFQPGANITRAELAVMAARAAGADLSIREETDFRDNGDIPVWARGAVANMKLADIIHGRDSNEFAPGAKTTRAEAVTIIMNLLGAISE
ncbi:S-layer homology domain-containing protein [Paenibacillus sp. HB172176]|uniref:RCC1 domain-containing protein n=1 Tax=Paenibacillus sp. HB172176 TaxID=2493690 RepID=UPI001F10E9CF|nr:S-layer homology domain-containing protein [Paenibacillus sp. HB172176]